MTHVPLGKYHLGQEVLKYGANEWKAHETIIIINKLVLRARAPDAEGGEARRHVGNGGIGCWVPGAGCRVLMRAKIKYEKCYEFSNN